MTLYIHHLKLDSNDTVQLKINLKIKYQSQEKRLCKKKKKTHIHKNFTWNSFKL